MGGVKARARLGAQLAEDTRVQQGRGAVLALAKIASRAPPSLLHHHHTPAPSRRLHGAAWPSRPALTAAGRMRSANAAPVGFLLNCRAVAVAAPKSAEGTRGQLRAHSPAWPASPKGSPLPRRPPARTSEAAHALCARAPQAGTARSRRYFPLK